MNRKWLIVLIGIGLMVLANLIARFDVRVSEAEIIRSLLSNRIDWRTESALLRGTLTQVAFLIGLVAVIITSSWLIFEEKEWLGKKGVALLLLVVGAVYLCAAVAFA